MEESALSQAAEDNFGLGFGVAIPFVNHLGFELKLFEGGLSETAYAPKPEHLNSFAVTHGGALMTLLDVTMAAASRSVQSDMGVVTIEMKTTFMQPARGKLNGCLLYTSPSPRDRQKSRMPSSA